MLAFSAALAILVVNPPRAPIPSTPNWMTKALEGVPWTVPRMAVTRYSTRSVPRGSVSSVKDLLPLPPTIEKVASPTSFRLT